MPTQLGLDSAITEQESATTALSFLQSAIGLLDEALRSTRNAFRSGALLDHGTAAGTLPRLGAGGLLDQARLPASIPFTRVVAAGSDNKLTAAQIPRFYAKKLRGVVPVGRFGGMPAWKIQSIPTGAKLSADQLPEGYTREQWPTSYGVGGPGVTDEDGTTIGQTSAFVHQLHPTAAGQSESTTYEIQGSVVGDALRLQILATYRRHNATPAAAAGSGNNGHPDWLNGPPANLINPPHEPGNGNGNGNGREGDDPEAPE